MIWILLVVIAFCLMALVRNERVFCMRMLINQAIFVYSVDCIENDYPILVDYSDMEPYGQTMNRLWDWGYTRILPPEQYKLIEPYLFK